MIRQRNEQIVELPGPIGILLHPSGNLFAGVLYLARILGVGKPSVDRFIGKVGAEPDLSPKQPRHDHRRRQKHIDGPLWRSLGGVWLPACAKVGGLIGNVFRVIHLLTLRTI